MRRAPRSDDHAAIAGGRVLYRGRDLLALSAEDMREIRGRDIAKAKAYTANAFSLPGLALSTANLYAAVQPGGTLYGLQHSNPVDTSVAYRGPAANFGQDDDPMIGRRIGGVKDIGVEVRVIAAPSPPSSTAAGARGWSRTSASPM